MAAPSAQEQLVLQLVNRARLDPAAEAARFGIDLNAGLAPGTITAAQKQILAFNPLLNDAADTHTAWMLATNTFSHTGEGGSNPGGRMAAAGYVFSGSSAWGENIAWNGTTGTLNINSASALFHQQLFESAGHRTNILNDGFKELGVGLAAGPYSLDGFPYNALMGTENFARSGSNNFIAGAVYADANGDDFYTIGEGQGGVTVELRAGTTLLASTATWASGGYTLATTSAGALKVSFSGGGLASTATASINAGASNVMVDLLDGNTIQSSVTTTVSGAAVNLQLLGLNAINGAGGGAANIITGNKGANVLTGNGGNDQLFGGDGNDQLRGGAGADVLNGGAGTDIADYRAEAGLTINLATGVHTGNAAGDTFVSVEYIYGSSTGNDQLTGGAAADRLYGWGGADTLKGGGGNDILKGGAGADTIEGGLNNDSLYGEADADTFVFADVNWGVDTINAFEDGLDILRFTSAVADAFSDFVITANGTTSVTAAIGANKVIVKAAAPVFLTAADFEFVA